MRSLHKMKLFLPYLDDALGDAWRKHFGGEEAVTIIKSDITKVPCDAIVSPANSFGFMDGGLDYQLTEFFGPGVQDSLQEIIREKYHGELLVGQVLIISTENEKIPWLVCAPTMRVPMHIQTSINAYLSMKAILVAVNDHTEKPEINSIAVPGLGTGVGSLAPQTAAYQMWVAYEEIVLGKDRFPKGFGDAQDLHIDLNPLGRIYE